MSIAIASGARGTLALLSGPEWIEWTRPEGALLAVLPLAYLWLLWRGRRPRVRVSGVVFLWSRNDRADSGARRRFAVSAEWLALMAALVLGVLALMGPERIANSGERAGVEWTFVVDRGVALDLPVSGSDSDSRRARMLSAARELYLANTSQQDRIRWVSSEREPWQAPTRGWAQPPDAWLAGPGPVVDWEAWDRPGVVWLTDREPALRRRFAGLVAGGGEQVPGPIAYTSDGLAVWDGGQVVLSDFAHSPNVRLESEAISDAWSRFVGVWCKARGYRCEEEPATANTILTIRGPGAIGSLGTGGDSDTERWNLSGVGWQAFGEGPRSAAERIRAQAGAAGRVALFGRSESHPGESIPLAVSSPGQLWVAWERLSEPTGDRAAFALDAGELLDGAAAAPQAVVPLEARRAALAATDWRSRSSSEETLDAETPESRTSLDTWLAGVAALLALLGVWLGTRSN